MIMMAYWKCSIRASSGRSWSPTKKTNSRKGRKWTVPYWPVNLVYLHHLRHKYKPSWTRLVMCQALGLVVEDPMYAMD